MRAIALMSWWQLRNSLRTTLTEPRKLIPLLVFAAAMGLNVFNFVFLGSMGHNERVPFVSDYIRQHLAAGHAILFGVLMLAALGQLESGLTGGALTFTLSDVDYLFPSPISRRVVLAYKVPMILLRNLFYGAMFLVFAYMAFWRFAVGEGGAGASALPLYLAVSGWLMGYTCLAVALEVVFGLAKAGLARRWLWGFVLTATSIMVVIVWRGGLDALRVIERSPLVWIPMYPCRLLADVFASPLTGKATGPAVAQLLVFTLAALLILLTRKEDYYEATLAGSERIARMRAAAKQGNFAAIFAARARERSRPAKVQSRTYTLPPFGHGAGALLWAHFSAAAKRPLINFAAPFFGGLALSAGMITWGPSFAANLVLGVDAYLTWIFLLVATRTAFRQCMQLSSLVRPIPIPAWKTVIADVAPIVTTGSLFGWGAALPLLGYGGPDALLIAVGMLVVAPALIGALALVQYIIALWYPSVDDKLQQLLSGMVSMALMGAVALGIAPFVVIPAVLHAPLPLTLAISFVGCGCAGTVLLLFATSVYRRVETE